MLILSNSGNISSPQFWEKRLYVIEKLRFQTENNSEPKRDSRLYEKRRHSNIMNRQLMLGYNG